MSGYRYPFAGFLLATLLIDAVTKSWFWQSRPDLMASHWFNLIYFKAHQNNGIMLGIGAQLDSDYRLMITVLLPGLVLSILLSLLLYKGFSGLSLCLAWGLLLGGGISNLIERIKSGSVSDFIIIRLADIQSGIFNLADLANLVGVILLIGFVMFRGKVR